MDGDIGPQELCAVITQTPDWQTAFDDEDMPRVHEELSTNPGQCSPEGAVHFLVYQNAIGCGHR
jgi:hypothetical protein